MYCLSLNYRTKLDKGNKRREGIRLLDGAVFRVEDELRWRAQQHGNGFSDSGNTSAVGAETKRLLQMAVVSSFRCVVAVRVWFWEFQGMY